MANQDFCISNVLCFISTARLSYTEETMISLCSSFYKADELYEAKDKLCQMIGQTPKKRRGDDRLKSEVLDILAHLRKCDEDDMKIPKFVSDGYNKMPPSSGFEVIAEHVISLLTEVTALKTEVCVLKNLNFSSGVSEMKEDLRDIKMLVSKISAESTTKNHKNNCELSLSRPFERDAVVPSTSSGAIPKKPNTEQKSINPGFSSSKKSDRSNLPVHAANRTEDVSQAPRLRSNGSCDPQGPTVQQEERTEETTGAAPPEDVAEWTIVRRRKSRKFLTGSNTTNTGNFCGVEETRDLYVGRCNQRVEINDIKEHIRREFSFESVKCIQISNDESPTKSFKVTVLADQLDLMLNSDKWPANIRIRRYFMRFNQKNGRSN